MIIFVQIVDIYETTYYKLKLTAASHY